LQNLVELELIYVNLGQQNLSQLLRATFASIDVTPVETSNKALNHLPVVKADGA